jgi:hypothetical protein
MRLKAIVISSLREMIWNNSRLDHIKKKSTSHFSRWETVEKSLD